MYISYVTFFSVLSQQFGIYSIATRSGFGRVDRSLSDNYAIDQIGHRSSQLS